MCLFQVVKEIAKELFLEVIREDCVNISVKLVDLLREFQITELVCQELVDEYTR